MEIEQTSQPTIDSTQIFTLRLWQEQVNGGCWEWRGRVQHVVSGEVRYFRDWERLIDLLQAMLSNDEQMRC